MGNYQKNVNIKVPCGMIIGDMQGGDKHCGSSVCYLKSLNRLCRQCNVKGDDSGNPLIQCKKMSMSKIRQYVLQNRTDKLQKICQYNVNVAWFDVDFGGCDYGVFSAAMPVEALHALEGGLMIDVLTILFKVDLKPLMQARLDALAVQMTKWDKQHFMTAGTNPDMPRTLFKDGVTRLTKLAHTHYVGILLVVTILSMTDDGKKLFLKAFKKCGYKNPTKRLGDMRYIFQMLLCYWAWLKKEKYWQLGNTTRKKEAKGAISKMLSLLIKLWPRQKGQGWCKAKLHEQLHVPRDIERNGSPNQSYSGPLEHSHLELKDHAKRTQRNRKVLDKQIGDRLTESFVINYCFDRMQHKQMDLNPINTSNTSFIPHTASKGLVTLKRNQSGKIVWSFKWKTKSLLQKENAISYNQMALTCLIDQFGSKISGAMELNVFTFTEYIRNGVTFRAHPFYSKSESPWHDWVMLRYDKHGISNKCKRYKFGLEMTKML